VGRKGRKGEKRKKRIKRKRRKRKKEEITEKTILKKGGKTNWELPCYSYSIQNHR